MLVFQTTFAWRVARFGDGPKGNLVFVNESLISIQLFEPLNRLLI
jgi:hypothetical protein